MASTDNSRYDIIKIISIDKVPLDLEPEYTEGLIAI